MSFEGSARAVQLEECDETAILAWLVEQVARISKRPVNEIDITAPFAYYGMDSLQGVELTMRLEDKLGREISPTVAYEYPNIQALARHLAEPFSAGAPRPGE